MPNVIICCFKLNIFVFLETQNQLTELAVGVFHLSETFHKLNKIFKTMIINETLIAALDSILRCITNKILEAIKVLQAYKKECKMNSKSVTS